ncbi:hypothetical protein N3K66_003831 [Trichothecium roseum]|uniref:Uncharacterized protein n=1 Tax=Trichothecium roseum TaxID=47278 RepID=A0ACC0V8G8_9HYPO|nr:hypothetical protein N3K66_003831 [Trichothecium roseum]
MAPNIGEPQGPPNQAGGFPNPGPNDKTLHVWSKPVEEADAKKGGTRSNNDLSISDAVSMIKPEDFTNVQNTPCARTGLLTGIGAGFGIGGVRFLTSGNIGKSTNWAVGIFLLGSIASYEYCQYQRRAEKLQMKRHIEVVNQGRREQAKKMMEAQKEKQRAEMEQKVAQKTWYKFW